MANNYLEFSEVIDNLTDEEIVWWRSEILRIHEIQEKIESGEIEDDLDDDSLCFEFELDASRRRVWFHPDESGNPGAVADVVHRFLKETGRKDCFWLNWAEYCSKPRIGEFGGGAIFVTAKGVEWHTTGDWIQEKRNEFVAESA